ncbi:MAG: NADP-dependent glyceraldehyde-3-phosphate dehydrogenase [Kiritimatiellae bacterium]|nr:NADP-dependent glyceraldehyde-3-phosphate dehydrogenase [Kiritimatiellia bacterium]MDD4736524.1 NADP-dependent glyceraldehyde-3-phosphate dehydrogenase [Kiritimatiellia bacterium]
MNIAQRMASIFPTADAIPEKFRLTPIHQTDYLISGELKTWDGPFGEVWSPICCMEQEVPVPIKIGSHPRMNQETCQAALDAAVKAYDHGQGLWPTLPVSERIRHVEEFTWRMKEKRTEVVNLLMWEIGKSLADSEKEFDRTVDYIVDTIDALKELDRVASRFTIQSGILGQIRRAPLGVVLCMGPYNYPLNETFTTLIPALIMGNTVVFKPAKLGILLWGPLLEAFQKAFPPGVVNTVYGEGRTVVGPLMAGGQIDCLAFIGSSKVADTLKHQHPNPHRLRCVLGLDAKNAAIILPDADMEAAVSECVLGALSFNGQRCTALKILFVHASVADEFLKRLVDAVNKLPFGMPWENGVKITPLPVRDKPKQIAEWLEDARLRGANVLNECGGTAQGTYCHPAVVYPITPDMQLYSEEQFGPVIPVIPFTDISEPVRYVVQSNYGQQVSIFGRQSDQIARLVDPLVNQVCRVNINSQCQRGPDSFPFTGRKDSAEGTLSVSDALRVFSIRTLVAAKNTQANRELLTTVIRERQSSFLNTDFIF